VRWWAWINGCARSLYVNASHRGSAFHVRDTHCFVHDVRCVLFE
jgi:hypothetical protein